MPCECSPKTGPAGLSTRHAPSTQWRTRPSSALPSTPIPVRYFVSLELIKARSNLVFSLRASRRVRQVPLLQPRSGLKTWIPSVDRTATTFFETWEDLMTSSLDDPTKARFLKSQWAPENIEDLHIERWYVIFISFGNSNS